MPCIAMVFRYIYLWAVLCVLQEIANNIIQNSSDNFCT